MSTEDRSTTADATAYPLLDAAAGRTPSHRPVWFMRQAGRSLPEYRKVREGVGMLQSCFRPDLVTEITLQPVRRHRTDAAILFSDIVVPLKAAGIDLDIVSGIGPVIEQPIRDAAAVAAMPRLDVAQVEPIAEAVRMLRGELPAGVALIGFAGAPFTLASYLVEGGPSRNHERTKALMYSEPETWHALLDALADIAITFLRVQADAGAQAFQLFDSWAGALSLVDYREYVQPHSAKVFAALRESAPALPAFHFGVGSGELLGAMGEAGADVVGVDWRVPLEVAARRIGPGKALQGNLDPATLMADRDTVEAQVRRVVADADAALATGATGHVFNLGHGVLPSTDPDVLTRVVELVHAL
ncbi:uroporphyrinogen decarboxylase [Tsukamurella pulmonis]|uniref:uroporphyrinogen decarboxylase n=2 Tax=Tsukamurella pulmonis TaxID=47312 RepID=UPI000791149E|nr:uroporphyrinogen decarboxylase [Tsukamurella pulmonis]KXP09628.1 uroporphyrinogen decarboxylase [Tsukamurella pulmonis]